MLACLSQTRQTDTVRMLCMPLALVTAPDLACVYQTSVRLLLPIGHLMALSGASAVG